MLPVRRVNTAIRTHHSLSAEIVAHTTQTTGWWIFKKSYPALKFRFLDDEYRRFRKIIEGLDPALDLPSQTVQVVMDSQPRRNNYKIGSKVQVRFSTASMIDGFFAGAEPFKWEGLSDPGSKVIAA